ncbi:hypothetical protein CANARDRAFT_28689 [[Candida] arabinofermentans NRRL YB-2248]|uniref:PRP1 splicing factor N-terminal domain-containing protein n=1 Tax=[Candida] arabinofermentans NRRL YB-2248 TaxID=983967 RepID=A0A1E4SZM3_9ASCO|nr:hypothetical protein CANARDRAFT_28689 [[Candida] arabinofermentans NRRL YB-2248]
MERKSFLDQEAPPGYVAGLGRGASGFTTQADLGSSSRLPPGQFANDENDDDDGRFGDAADDDVGLRYGELAEDDDEEADRIYQDIEKRIQEKKQRSRKRKLKGTEETEDDQLKATEITMGQSLKTIGEEFKEYKEGLSSISVEEWTNLPESGDFTRRNKRTRKEMQEQQRFYRNSDSVTVGLKDSDNTVNTLEENTDIDLAGISSAKDKVLAGSLINSGAVGTSIDQSEYLKQLGVDTDGADDLISSGVVSNVGDYYKTRTLFSKMRESNPYKPDTWIASARLEWGQKKFAKARELIQEGCRNCAKSEQVWLINIEMNQNDLHTCKVIVAEAIRYNSKSPKLWLKAAELENEKISKKRVLRKALEFLPTNVELWLQTAKYEENNDMAIKMLTKATELIPTAIELWLKLAELETTENAKRVLNSARKAVNAAQSHTIWIEAAKLEERSTENEIKVDKLITRCFKDTSSNLGRYEWLREAVLCENDNCKLTARAIVLNCMSIGLEEETDEQKLQIWEQDAESSFQNRNLEVARSIYLFITSNYPSYIDAWLSFITMESSLKNYDGLFIAYEMAIQANPNNIQLYLRYAKDKWLIDDNVGRARDILSEGLERNGDSEDLWYAAIKLEWQTGSTVQVLELFDQCRDRLADVSPRVWYKNVNFLRTLGKTDLALKMIDDGLNLHPTEPKLYMQMGQIYEDLENYEKARDSYHMGTKACSDSSILWVSLSRIDEQRLNKVVRARSILDQGLAMNPIDDMIFLERIALEKRAGNHQQSRSLLAKGLKTIPNSPLLWKEEILSAKASQRKNVYTMALNKTDDNPLVILTIAKDMWNTGKISRAKQFFDACLAKDPDFGDCYIQYYLFLLKHGSTDELEALEKMVVENDPHHGPEWCSVSKKIGNQNLDAFTLLIETVKTLS